MEAGTAAETFNATLGHYPALRAATRISGTLKATCQQQTARKKQCQVLRKKLAAPGAKTPGGRDLYSGRYGQSRGHAWLTCMREGTDMTEEATRMCSTRTALSDMLETASGKLERALRVGATAHLGNTQSGLEQARKTVAELTARLANHRSLHGC